MLRFLYTLSAIALLPLAVLAESVTLRNEIFEGPSRAENISDSLGYLDWPKLLPGVNDTSYDWWYFDVVSADAKTSATVIFYNSGEHGFINNFLGGPLSVSISGILPNGSLYDVSAPATTAVITRDDDDNSVTSGVWSGSGFSFNSTMLDHPTGNGKVKYVVTIDASELGISGTVTLVAAAPAHYPCGLEKAGASEALFPNVFWSNAVPAAVGEVDLLINDTELKIFHSVGYHDKNWGDKYFPTTTSTWYWGHATVDSYSVVWFDAVDIEGKRYTSSYVAKDGLVLQSSCEYLSVQAKPWGTNSEWPPKIASGVPQGMEIAFKLDPGVHGAPCSYDWLRLNVTTTQVAIDNQVYFRLLGTVTGKLCLSTCCKTIHSTGAALYEEFKFTQ